MNVPFVNLQMQHQRLLSEIMPAIKNVVTRGDFILGAEVERFEEEFAAYCNTHYAVGVDSGLSALELSLRALGIAPGDEVIVPAHTFVATASAVTFAGAQPKFVDVNPVTFNLDVEKLEAAITPRTRAIIPVHLYGLPAEMDTIRRIADKNGLFVLEDACQAHGALYKGQRVGSFGHAAAFSFYPSKNLGALGDAGMVVTNDSQLADRVRAMRNCGQRSKNVHELSPFNHRLDTLQAAVLRIKLPFLDGWNEARRQWARRYSELLAGSEIATPTESPESTHVFHLYVIRSAQRDTLQAHLKERGIATGIHYPIPVHLQPYYQRNESRKGQFPVAERLCGEILSLPMCAELSAEQVQYVAEQVLEFKVSAATAG